MAEVTSVLREMQLDTKAGLAPARASAPLDSRRHSMAEVTSVLREMQLVTKAGLAPVRVSAPLDSRRHSKFVKEDGGGFKEADAGIKEAAGTFIGEIGVTKSDAGNKEGARSFTAEIGVAKVEAGIKETAGSFIGEICVAKEVEPGIKGAAGSFIGEICVSKDAGKEVARTVEIVDTEAEVGKKEAFGKGVITEADWINFVFLVDPPAGIESKPGEATGITKERVPDCFIDILKSRHLFRKLPPASRFNNAHSKFPHLRYQYLQLMTRRNYCVDLHVDVLRQLKKKGFAEVGVDFTDGVKKLFILPQH